MPANAASKGGRPKPSKSEKDKKLMIVVTNKLMKPEPKSYTEAKGMVTADYQNFLEKDWIGSLKTKYPVNIDKAVLSTVK